MNIHKALSLSFIVGLLFLRCGGTYKTGAVSGEYKDEVKVKCEAYLFDARVYHDNKYNSFRLEVFYNDSLIGLGGRGYLGKGALKGYITDDSLLVYFPESDEYIREQIVDLFNNSICIDSLSDFDLKALFSQFPDSVISSSILDIESDYEDEAKPSFKITAESCDWTIDLFYGKQSSGWRLSEFYFDDGADLRLRGRLREFQGDAEIAAGKFRAEIPASAVRIIP